MTPEQTYAQLLTGTPSPSVLMTDGYKFSMAQAGFPLREETFYLSCRKGGPYYIPFNFAEVATALIPDIQTDPDAHDVYLNRYGYGMTLAMKMALRGPLKAWAPPVGSWVADGSPVLTVTGPSFLVSWLEPLAIMMRFPLQVATALMNGETTFRASCIREAHIVQLVADSIARIPKAPIIIVDNSTYRVGVCEATKDIQDALDGDQTRALEVGLRAASCMPMHEAALRNAHPYICNTSNVYLAEMMGIRPIGTTGHEHQQRWMTDEDGFRAIRDMRAGPPSYLFDTYDTMQSGIPAAIQVMRETPGRPCFVRFDSGDQDAQMVEFIQAGNVFGISPGFIFEDGYTAERTRSNEVLCWQRGIPKSRCIYGYGGYLINPPRAVQFRRDDASAVYKLSQTGTIPVRKSCGSKSSIPGIPVILRDDKGTGRSIIAQKGERVIGWHDVTADDPRPLTTETSPETSRLIETCNQRLPRVP